MKCLHPFWLHKLGFYVPCGRCAECKRQRRLAWANRIMVESNYWPSTAFVTLTYQDCWLPDSLEPEHLTKFFKRLRRDLPGRKIKYYACGEYGEKGRPHYHFIGFGLDSVKDREVIKENWPYCDWLALESSPRGREAITSFSYGTAYYVAGYVQKKLYGDKAKENYEMKGLYPPFSRMSKGIGLQFALDNKEILSKTLTFSRQGYTVALPKYFRDKLGVSPDVMSEKHFDRVIQDKRFQLFWKSRSWIPNVDDAIRCYGLWLESSKNAQDSVYQREIDALRKEVLFSRGEL